MVRIKEKRRTHGIVQHLVEWADTEHPSSVLRRTEDGRCTIDVDGLEWEISKRLPAGKEDPNTGEQLELITWKPSWHFEWELPKQAVGQFERKNGEVKRHSEEGKEPSWWIWTEYPEYNLAPEAEPHPSTKKPISLDLFQPQSGADYTISFLEQMRQRVVSEDENSTLAKTTLIRFLNLRIRQRLQFQVAAEEGEVFCLERPERLRSLLVYIFGMAQVIPCSLCKDEPGPFPKCVTWTDEFRGACANCAFKRHVCGSQCEYHARSECFPGHSQECLSDNVQMPFRKCPNFGPQRAASCTVPASRRPRRSSPPVLLLVAQSEPRKWMAI